MARKGGIGTEEVIALGVLGVGGYLLATGKMDEVIERVKEVLDNIGGKVKERVEDLPLPVPGGGGGGTGGGAITTGGSCPGGQNCTPCRPQSGGIRCECNGVKIASYEATFCGTWSGDDLSIKMWGPTHSSGKDCCWCILSISPDGQFGIRHEGPHPDTGSKSGSTSIGGKPSCVKGVISPGPKGAHVEGWGLVGGSWKKAFTYDGPCGHKQKSTKPHANQQVSFRCDGNLSAKCATVKPLGASSSYARTLTSQSHFARISIA